MRRKHLDLAQRRDAQLHAGAAHLDAAHALLDDAAVLAKAAEVALREHLRVLEGHGPRAIVRGQGAPRPIPAPAARAARPSALPRPATPSLSLTIASVALGRAARSASQGVYDVVEVANVLEPLRVRDPCLGEQPPAARLGPQRQEPGVGAVERHAEGQREVALEWRSGVRDQVAACAVGDEGADLSEDPRPLEQLVGERARRAVVRGDEVQPGTGMARDDAGQQREVVLDDALRDRSTGDVDDLQPRVAQEQQQEEEALLVGLELGPAHLRPVGDDRGDHHDRLAGLVEPHRAPHGDEALLQPSESLAALALAQVTQPRVGGGGLAHADVRAASRPSTL